LKEISGSIERLDTQIKKKNAKRCGKNSPGKTQRGKKKRKITINWGGERFH